jgi:hypothetical protein
LLGVSNPAADRPDAGTVLYEEPDLFFPIGCTGPTLEQIGEAKAVCRLLCG